jgi:hypothetical protein
VDAQPSYLPPKVEQGYGAILAALLWPRRSARPVGCTKKRYGRGGILWRVKGHERDVLEYLIAMDHDDHGDPSNGLESLERWLKANAERWRESNHINFGEFNELPEEDRQALLKILAVGAGIGLGALGLYLGKRAADGIAQTDLPETLRRLENIPVEILERIRAGWSGSARRGQRIIIPDE